MSIELPRFAWKDIFRLINRLAAEIEKKHGGRIPHESLLDIAIANAFREDPDRMDLAKYARHCRQRFDRANRKVIVRPDGGVLFVPGSLITPKAHERVRMRLMEPVDLIAWGETEATARANILRVFDGRVAYRAERLREAALRPDLRNLGDIEQAFHGYVPSKGDDNPDLGNPRTDDDDEDGPA